MGSSTLKKQTISGMIWSAIGKFGTMGISFVSNMVLARLLMPSDYGAIAMVHIFIALSNLLVIGGFTSALIQKKDAKHIDYTSVFYFNIVVSFILYVTLFFCAPAISRFYEMPRLCKILRVQCICIIISAFSAVQTSILSKELKFKVLTNRSIIASLCATTVSITMAFCGCGVWSLVASSLISSTASVFLLWKMSSWRPTREFSFASLKELFAFGGLLMLSSAFTKLFSELQALIIGKYYSAKDLGYYQQARLLEQIPTESLTQIVTQVSFPVFSKLQTERDTLRAAVKKNITSLTYANFGLVILLIVIATPLIRLLYGFKWDHSIPYFQILCISGMFQPLNNMNVCVIKSLGKSKMLLSSHIIYKSVGIAALFVGIQFGINGLLWAVVFSALFMYVMTTAINKHLIGYGMIQQLIDIGGNMIAALSAGGCAFAIGKFLTFNQYGVMFIQIAIYALAFIGISIIFKLDGFNTYKEVAIDYLKKIKRK